MELLLDTHAFIWFALDDPQLPENTNDHIKNPETKCFISVASLWEIAIKLDIGKLKLKTSFSGLLQLIVANNIDILPIKEEHFLQLLKLGRYHKDPFDRIIIAQALTEHFTIATKDENFKHYKVKILWN